MLSNLIKIIREDLATYNGDLTRPGLHALLVHRFGNWVKSIKSRPLRAPLSLLSKAMFVAARNFYGIELPFNAYIGRRVVFEHQHGIIVHGNAVIGDDCTIRQGVTLGIRRMSQLHLAPTLGNGVDVGAGAKLLGNVRVGDNATIGANSVVLYDIPKNSVVAGVPARVKAVFRQLDATEEAPKVGHKAEPVITLEAPGEQIDTVDGFFSATWGQFSCV